MLSVEAEARAGSPHNQRRKLAPDQAAFVAWVTLVAPGHAASIGALLLALLVAPALTRYIYVEPAVRFIAALLLAAHLAGTLWAVRGLGVWPSRVFCVLLVIDAVLGGLLVGAPWQLSGVAMPVVVVLATLSLVIAGWPGVLCAAGAMTIGVAAAAWHGVGSPLIFSPTPVSANLLTADVHFADVTVANLPSPTLLLVEPYFGGVLSTPRRDYSFATELLVEPRFAGVPGLGSAAALFPAALTAGLLALCGGSALSLLRLRGGLVPHAPPCPPRTAGTDGG
jgi:hypothetical protein